MPTQVFPPADKKKVLGNLACVRKGEGPKEYFDRITAEAHDASDHKFESGEVAGVCKHCGWIHPDLKCDDCGEPMREHAIALGKVVSGGTMTIDIIVVGLPRRRGLLDRFMKN